MAAHFAHHRCCEDPQTDRGQRAVQTLMGMSGSCGGSRDAPLPPCPLQGLQVLSPPLSLAEPSAPSRCPLFLPHQTRRLRQGLSPISMSPVLGIALSTTQIMVELNLSESLMSLQGSHLLLCTTSACPHAHTHMQYTCTHAQRLPR